MAFDRTPAALLPALALIAAPVWAQDAGKPGDASEPRPAGVVEFETAPLPIPELGVELHLPHHVYIDGHYFAGGRKRVRVASNKWTLQIYSAATPDTTLTTEEVIDSFIAQRQASNISAFDLDKTDLEKSGRLPVEVEREDKLKISGRTASRAYMHFPNQSNGMKAGYTVFKNQATGDFLVFQFDALEKEFAGVQSVYETIVATAKFIEPDAGKLVAQAASVRAGDAFLDRVTPEDVESVLPDGPVYLRVYTPAPGGAESDAKEIAYQKVDIRKGQLGELDPERPRQAWKEDGPEHEWGFIVRVDGRFLHDQQVIDMRAIMWLSRDFDRESAAVTTTASVLTQTRDGRTKQSFQTLLERVGERLTVNDLKPGMQPEVRDWVAPPDAYIPGVLLYLLPRLVIHERLEASDLGFYHYNMQTSGISIRRDTFKKSAFGWERLEARTADSTGVFRSTYTHEGELVRNEWPNGTVMEPIEQARLIKIWKSKDLPIR